MLTHKIISYYNTILTETRSRLPEQLIPWVTLTYMATRGVDAVMITASIVISTLIDVCN